MIYLNKNNTKIVSSPPSNLLTIISNDLIIGFSYWEDNEMICILNAIKDSIMTHRVIYLEW